MRNHRKAAQGRRVEFLEHHPVADHVLDIVGHHREHVGGELRAKAGMSHGGKRTHFGRRGRAPCCCIVHGDGISVMRMAVRSVPRFLAAPLLAEPYADPIQSGDARQLCQKLFRPWTRISRSLIYWSLSHTRDARPVPQQARPGI